MTTKVGLLTVMNKKTDSICLRSIFEIFYVNLAFLDLLKTYKKTFSLKSVTVFLSITVILYSLTCQK